MWGWRERERWVCNILEDQVWESEFNPRNLPTKAGCADNTWHPSTGTQKEVEHAASYAYSPVSSITSRAVRSLSWALASLCIQTPIHMCPFPWLHTESSLCDIKINRWRLVSTLTEPKICTGICIYANACVFLKCYNKMESLEGAMNTRTLTFGDFILGTFFSSWVYPTIQTNPEVLQFHSFS